LVVCTEAILLYLGLQVKRENLVIFGIDKLKTILRAFSDS